jgi:sporulation protein YunB
MVLTASIVVEIKLRPVIQLFAGRQAQAAAVRVIDEAVMEVLAAEPVTYQDLVVLREDGEGRVLAIETKTIEMNLLRTKLTRAIDKRLLLRQEQEASIPLGTLFGGNFLSGRGPELTFKLIPVGYVKTELRQQFLSAGINQTVHQILLHITVDVAVVSPGYSTSSVAEVDFPLAETVIVGAVPGLFAEMQSGLK